MKRILASIGLLSLLGAGCMGAPVAPPVPVKPVPPVTTAPEVPEFAKNWLIYRSGQFGFSFRYPKASGQALQPKQIDLGTAVENPGKMDVPKSFMEVKLLASDDASLKNHYYALNGWGDGAPTDVRTETINGLTWYIHSEGDAGAGNYYNTISYVTLIGNTHVVLAFTNHSVACENYGDDWQTKCVKYDDARDTALFHKIVETYLPKQE